MKKIILSSLFFLVFLSFVFLNAQWVKTYGESTSEIASLILPTSDGGFIIAGFTQIPLNWTTSDVWFLKLDIEGKIEWQNAFHSEDKDISLLSMWQTNDGGYAAAGLWSYVSSDIDEFWIINFSSSGNINSIKYRVIKGGYLVKSIRKTDDGGLLLMGNSSSGLAGEDVWIIKLSQTLDKEWQYTYGGINDDRTFSIQQTSDGGYILTGSTFSFGVGGEDIWVLKLSGAGDIEWQRTYGGADDDKAYSIQQTSEGGYILAGSTFSFGVGGEDIWVLKFSDAGDIEWQRTYGGTDDDRAYSIQQTSDGGYIIGSNTRSLDTGDELSLVLKLTNFGDVEWQKIYGIGLGEKANTIKHSSDGGYIVAGTISSFGAGKSDFWVLKLLQDGNIGMPCRFIQDASITVIDTYILPEDVILSPGNVDINIYEPPIHDYSQQSTNAVVYELCSLKPLLAIHTSDGGTTDPEPGTHIYDFGTEVSITAKPDTGGEFTGWSGDATGSDNPISITLDEDKSVTASFFVLKYALKIIAGEGGTTNPKPGIYSDAPGTEVIVEAVPNTGYKFSEWSGDVSGTDNPIIITLDSNKSVTANFITLGNMRSVDGVTRVKCFIVSAVYGSPSHPYVKILRDFKGKYLLPNKIGQELVNLYYKYSPLIADFVSEHKMNKFAIRLYLFPIVVFSYSMVHFGSLPTTVMLIFISTLSFLFVDCWRRSRIRGLNIY